MIIKAIKTIIYLALIVIGLAFMFVVLSYEMIGDFS